VSTSRPGRRGRIWITAPVVTALVLLKPILSADATYPGANGEIAYLDGTFRAAQPDGSNDRDDRIVASKVRSNGEWLNSFDLRPSWSPDGTAVVFGAQRNRAYPEIWSVNSDGSNLQKLTHTTRLEFAPVFSPDGLRIVYARGARIYSNELWIMDSDGANQAQLLVRPSGLEYPLAWRPT
jgi:Tol biopolymer transport system component